MRNFRIHEYEASARNGSDRLTGRVADLNRRALVLAALTSVIAVATAGCNFIGAAAYYLSPPKKQKPSFVLTERSVAIVIEAPRSAGEDPVFTRTLYDSICALFRENKVKSHIVPLADVFALRQEHSDFASWSVQRVGRELGADQVLYLKINDLHFRDAPDHPILEPRVNLSVRVIGVNEPSVHARLWPEKAEGELISATRPVREASDHRALDEEATKLALDVSRLVARLFYEYDLEERPKREK